MRLDWVLKKKLASYYSKHDKIMIKLINMFLHLPMITCSYRWHMSCLSRRSYHMKIPKSVDSLKRGSHIRYVARKMGNTLNFYFQIILLLFRTGFCINRNNFSNRLTMEITTTQSTGSNFMKLYYYLINSPIGLLKQK